MSTTLNPAHTVVALKSAEANLAGAINAAAAEVESIGSATNRALDRLGRAVAGLRAHMVEARAAYQELLSELVAGVEAITDDIMGDVIESQAASVPELPADPIPEPIAVRISEPLPEAPASEPATEDARKEEVENFSPPWAPLAEPTVTHADGTTSEPNTIQSEPAVEVPATTEANGESRTEESRTPKPSRNGKAARRSKK